MEATSPVKCIEGGVLVDLCMQRSGKRGSVCDVPNKADKFPRSANGSLEVSKGFPTPVTSALMPPKPLRTEVRQYSWRRKEVCMHILILKPLETKKEEENQRKDGEVTALHLIHEKTMTSLSLSRQKSEGQEQQCSVNTERIKSENSHLVHVYQYTTNIYTESRKEQREIRFKRPESANCQNSGDVISDGTNRGGDVNRLVARECYATMKHSFSHTKEFLEATLNICKQFFFQLAIILAVVISLIGSGLNMNLLKLVCIAGLAVVVCKECGNNSNCTFPLAISVLVYAILAVLRGFTAAITNISEVLGSYIPKVMVFDNKEVITRCVGVLQNTIMRGVTILPCYCTALETTTFAVNVLGGKHINAYIFPFANVYASWIDYFDTYTRNLESECKIMIFCKLVYLYICAFYLSWVSCEWATLSSVILYTLVYLSLKWINSVIRIHDKYQSYFLVGLALTCKASSQIRYILLHYRSNWRELRPLVTPSANCIKESIEPCIGQKRFMPSHAQVSHLPLSLLSPFLLLLCFGFCCPYYYYCYCCCYEYLLVKGSHKSSGYENKPEPEYSNDYECITWTKPALSLSPLLSSYAVDPCVWCW